MTTSTSVGETEEYSIKKKSWDLSFESIHPTERVLPFLLSIISLAGISKISCCLMKKEIQNLTDAGRIQDQCLSMNPPLDPHLNELQKELIHRVRILSIEKIATKIALISSLAILSIGEFWALSGPPVPHLRFYSLLGASIFGASSFCQYVYQSVEELLLERVIEMQED